VMNLRMIGYDDVLSIEHEDCLMSAREGLEQSSSSFSPILMKEARPDDLGIDSSC
jgi:hypothetical protein